MAADYLNDQNANRAPRFVRWISTKLQPFYGKKVINEPITATSREEAKRKARALAARYDEEFAMLKALSPDQAREFIAAGGIAAVRATYRALTSGGPTHHVPESYLLSDEPLEGVAPSSPLGQEIRLAMLDQLQEQRVEQAEYDTFVAKVRPIMLSAAAPEMSLDGLFDLWVRVRAPKRTDKHRRTLALFKACLKTDRDFRTVKIKRGKGVPFTGAELTLIMAKAEAEKFGGKRHVAVIWLLRLAVWTGARINELAQLRKDDVGVESGVPRIWIRERPEFGTSVKTGEDRKVPLHASIGDSFLAYARASKTDFIFDCFPNGEKGRAAWLICNFPSFRRDACKINGKATLHGMRHRFKDACTNAGIAEERCRALMGHSASDVHSRYGQGAGLKQLAADVAKLEPFAD